MPTRDKAIVLLSGGIDSMLCARLAQEYGYDIHALNISYGQPAAALEQFAAREIAMGLGLSEFRPVTIDMSYAMGGLLTHQQAVEECRTLEEIRNEAVSPEYVPARNMILLSLALGWAETLPAAAIYCGPNADDSPMFPDCSGRFINLFEKTARAGTTAQPDIYAPLLQMTKVDIVKSASTRSVPLEMTVSCYFPTEDQGKIWHCGRCDACIVRRDAFEQAKCDDPAQYRVEL